MQADAVKALYRLRRQTVELVNADFKAHRQLRLFSGRGLRRAEAAIGLLVLVHNLLVVLAPAPASKPGTATARKTEKTVA